MSEHGSRELWASRLDFMMACVGNAVGIGNVWRFPYLCYKNGGGAFLLPYILCVLVIGIPVMFVETALGQYTRCGGVGLWNISPLFKGIGYAMALFCMWESAFYNIIMTWVGYYFVVSFQHDLPWAKCGHSWNTNSCWTEHVAVKPNVMGDFSIRGHPIHYREEEADSEKEKAYTSSQSNTHNATNTSLLRPAGAVDPATEFWWNGALDLSKGVEEPGGVCVHLLVSLVAVWIVCYFCTWKGVRWSGKVVYVSASIPYVLLLALLVYAARLPGAGQGVTYYLQPRFHQLANPQVWFDAASQVMFSNVLALTIWAAYGSYCPFNNNCYRDVILVCILNSLTSLLAGFVVFSMLGQMAQALGQPIDVVATSGPGLAFIVYPRALSMLPVPQLWSVLFFFMLLLLGIDSQVGLVEGSMTSLLDMFPHWRRYRPAVLAVFSGIALLLGLPMITRGGMYVFQLLDYYVFGGFVLQLLCLFEVLVAAWLYGVGRLYDNISSMIGYRINPWMKISWLVLTPLSLAMIVAFQLVGQRSLVYNRTYVYPGWANGLGYTLAVTILAIIPLYAVALLGRTPGNLLERLRETTRSRVQEKAGPTTEQVPLQEPVTETVEL